MWIHSVTEVLLSKLIIHLHSQKLFYMKKFITFSLISAALLSCQEVSTNVEIAAAEGEVVEVETNSDMQMKTLYDFKSKTLEGGDFDFSALKGKRVLIVNTASECGYTPQYKQLQELQDEFGGDNFTVIGFPSNDFGSQEPGSNKEIAAFCEKNFGVTFPMMDKTPVKGEGQHPLYAWLTQKSQNGVSDAEVKWNFNKFLIDENGVWVAYYPSGTSPLDDKIVAFAEGK